MTTTVGMCDLCGEMGMTVHPRTVAWKAPAFGLYFENIDRCIDETACRKRVADRGDEWPILERGEKPKGHAA